MSSDQKPRLLTRLERRKKITKTVAIIASGAIIIFTMFAVTQYYERGLGNTRVIVNLSDLTETLIQKNSTIYVKPGNSVVYKEVLAHNSTLEGAFASSNEVTFYVFNTSELLTQNTSVIPNYIYTTGETTGTSIQIYLQAGVYYLEFSNENKSTLANVIVTVPFTITFSI